MYVSGRENIPKDKPVILASNHPNSFKDAVVVGMNIGRPMITLVRSDVFKSAFARWLLSLWRLIPVYRIQEGTENLKKNDTTFEICERELQNQGTLLIFSEGICVSEKRLRPLKKGTARIAFQAMKNIEDIYIVPTGINYTHFTQFGGEIMLGFGKPIRVSDYQQLFEENQAKAVNKLTTDLKEAMAKEIIIIDDRTREPLVESFFNIARTMQNETFLPWKKKDRKRLELEQQIALKVNNLSVEDRKQLEKEIDSYEEELKNAAINNEYFTHRKTPDFFTIMGLIVLFPVFLIGWLVKIFPEIFGKKVADKVVREIEFYDSIRLGASYVIYIMLYSGLLISLFYINQPLYTVSVLSIPLMSIIAAIYMRYFLNFISFYKSKVFKNKKPEVYFKLESKRNELMEKLLLPF